MTELFHLPFVMNFKSSEFLIEIPDKCTLSFQYSLTIELTTLMLNPKLKIVRDVLTNGKYRFFPKTYLS